MNRRGKLIAVLTGYAAAFAIALAAAYVRAIFSRDDGGMQAFGDLLFFAGAFAFLALVPSALAFYSLRSSELFWKVLSALSLVLACTGPIAGLHLHHQQLADPISGLLSLLRVFAAPVLCVGFVIGALIAPALRTRLLILVAALVEAAVSVYLVLSLFLQRRWI